MEQDVFHLLRRLLDGVTFIEWFIKVETPDGLIVWNMDEYQKHLVRDESRSIFINKSKKTGISTTLAGRSIHKGYVNEGRQIALVSTGQRIAGELLGKVYDEFDSMPVSIQVKMTKRSAEYCEFPNRARIYSLPSSDPGKLRGLGMRGTATDVVLDEYAHTGKVDKDLWLVTRDFQRFGGKVTINSTPKGKRGKYYDIGDPLKSNFHNPEKFYATSEWSYHEIHFTECPRLREQEEELRKDITEEDFKQEYCCEFLDESLAFFPYEILEGAQNVHSYVDSGKGIKNPIRFGIDFGKKVSETVIVVSEEYQKEKFRTLWIEIMPGVNYHEQREVIKQLAEIYDPVEISVDATGPGGQTMTDFLLAVESLSYRVVGCNLSAPFKEKIIIRTRLLMQRGRLDIPDRTVKYGIKLESQLHAIQRKTTISGEHTRYTGKDYGMDDMVWALALAVYKELSTDCEPIFMQIKDKGLLNLERILRR